MTRAIRMAPSTMHYGNGSSAMSNFEMCEPFRCGMCACYDRLVRARLVEFAFIVIAWLML